MATEVDPLRSTLDHLALDPRARSDRPYLITMLRRLGYSEAEIAVYLGETPAPAPEPEPEPAAKPRREAIPDDSGERVIEIEYTGPGLRDFQLVVPMSEEEMANYDPLGLGAGLEAGSMTIEGDPDEDELSSFLEGEGAISFDDEFAGDDDEFEAEADRDNDPIDVRDEDDEFASFGDDEEHPDDDAFGEGLDQPEGEGLQEIGQDDDAFGEDAGEGELDEAPFGAPEADAESDGPPVVKGRKLVSFSAVPLTEAQVRRLEAEAEAADPQGMAPSDSLQETGSSETSSEEGWAEPGQDWPSEQDPWPVEGSEDGAGAGDAEATWQSAATTAPSESPYWYDDWLLHSRFERRPDGGEHAVYFFAKGQSPNGTPAPLPDGYEVATNVDTGLPYLRAEGSDDSPAQAEARRKRIRMRRVQASSREEAEERLRSEGRHVLGSMPVDVQQHDEEPDRP